MTSTSRAITHVEHLADGTIRQSIYLPGARRPFIVTRPAQMAVAPVALPVENLVDDMDDLCRRFAAWNLKEPPRIIMQVRTIQEDNPRPTMWREAPKPPRKKKRVGGRGRATINNTEGGRVGKRASKKAARGKAAGGSGGGERTILEQMLSSFGL
ncbi:hypothetical protein EDC01DRAFT_777535 [Geopyxis carbonaria]|nr:hypothetical protein EDC01DRAFT_777535 [Geopyxis carbonaria]